MIKCHSCNCIIYPQVFEEIVQIKPQSYVSFDTENTGVGGFFRVELRTLSGQKLNIDTSSGSFDFSADRVFADGVQFLDLTVKNFSDDVLEFYVKLEGGE